MPRRPPLPSEVLVGRRRPKDPSHYDTLLAGFINEKGEPVGRTNPSDRWLIPAFTKLRKEGLIRMGMRMGFGGRPGPTDGIWYLRDGEVVLEKARAAKERVSLSQEEILRWHRDFMTAHKVARARASVRSVIIERFGSPEEADAWMSTEAVPGFGEMTADDLISAGRADEVLDHVRAVDAGVSA